MVRSSRKKDIILFFVCMCIMSAIVAGNDEELFLRGNKYYTQKDYGNAFQVYNMIKNKGRAVLYNMGNCLFHAEDYAGALVYWSRAEMGATGYEYHCIIQNKERALKKLGKQKESSWWQNNSEFLQSRLPYVSLFFLQLLFLICWWLFIVALRKKQGSLAKITQSVLCLCIAIFALMLGKHYSQHSTHAAIVVKKDAKLFAGPDKSFHVLSPILYADSAHVKETREGWYKIQYADMIGWVEEDVIQII